jgi:hypothetical protein
MATIVAVVGSVTLLASSQKQGVNQSAPPQIQLAPGLREVPDYRKVALEPAWVVPNLRIYRRASE